jgi:hypothetical protein
MAYATEGDTLHRLSTLVHGAAALKGAMGVTHERRVTRTPIAAGGSTSAVANPIAAGGLEVTVTCKFLDGGSLIADNAAAASLVATFVAADGGAGTVTYSNLVPSSSRLNSEARGGFGEWEQDFVNEGAPTVVASQ